MWDHLTSLTKKIHPTKISAELAMYCRDLLTWTLSARVFSWVLERARKLKIESWDLGCSFGGSGWWGHMTISLATINTSPATTLREARELVSHFALLVFCHETRGKGSSSRGR